MKIVIGKDLNLWHEKFYSALKQKCDAGLRCAYQIADLEKDNWLEVVQKSDIVIWKASYMGPKAVAQYLAKVYFIEKHLHKLVFPNYDTLWHFENKVAQNYIFKKHAIKTPKTVASFDCHDALEQLEQAAMPIVFKEPEGAGSKNVRLVKTRSQARNIIDSKFANQLWRETKADSHSILNSIGRTIGKPWFWSKIAKSITRHIEDNYYYQGVYWQEFVPHNDSDLRITVIGDSVAIGFWRRNRPNDFRASGSGRLDYATPVPEHIVRYCIDINKKCNFDSMAYDILFKDSDFLISEISCGYQDKAIYNAPGQYIMSDAGKLDFVLGHRWPQEIWVEWILRKASKELKVS